MKKILFATTALVASTSFAMADVDLSGSAEMGIFGGEGVGGVDIEDQFHTDIDVTFSMSGETDGGLTFGASIDIDESTNGTAFANRTGGGETIFVSGAYGTLTMGETDGALDWAMDEAIIGSALNDDHEHAGYNGNSLLDNRFTGGDDQVARYDYSFGGFAVGVSAEVQNGAAGDDTFGIGATYDGEFGAISYGFGLGYQQNDNGAAADVSATGFSASMSMDNGLSAVFNYTDYDNYMAPATGLGGFAASGGVMVDDHIGVAVGYEFGQFLVAANYGKFDTAAGDMDGYGLVANYDLGGGASLQAGYGKSDFDNGAAADQDRDSYSFGIAMSF
ncbi:outer membrane protein OmpU [Palleronia salina]|uniref:Outer membrane protein OmpU n=1 Tax=Palleronia salina TaxID=313368 RepID=A0A1M6DIH3_9RHOB|nr:porin [Palleronia salina]SHI72995.1 outer membrane protein OmpU [Palleronia salina]